MRLPFDINPIDFWPYTSWVTDRILEIDTWNGDQDSRDAARAEVEEIKNYLLDLFNASGIPARLDNKIVFECATRSGKTFYVGIYDGNLSVGFGMGSDYWNYDAKRRAWGPVRSECDNDTEREWMEAYGEELTNEAYCHRTLGKEMRE